jgi:hypothetical protein
MTLRGESDVSLDAGLHGCSALPSSCSGSLFARGDDGGDGLLDGGVGSGSYLPYTGSV